MRSDAPDAEAIGGVTEDPKDPMTGRALEVTAAAEVDDSPPSPKRCWIEWSWKQGSESRTAAARDVLRQGGG